MPKGGIHQAKMSNNHDGNGAVKAATGPSTVANPPTPYSAFAKYAYIVHGGKRGLQKPEYLGYTACPR